MLRAGIVSIPFDQLDHLEEERLMHWYGFAIGFKEIEDAKRKREETNKRGRELLGGK